VILLNNAGLSQLPVLNVSPSETYLDLFDNGEIFIQVENISGFRAYSITLSYDSQKLRCLSITRGSFFSNWNTFFFTLIDSNANEINVDESILGLGHENGTGDLFKIKFLALKEGNVNINFLNADLRDTLNNAIQVQTNNGVVHIVNPTSVIVSKEDEFQSYLISYPNPFNSSTKIDFRTKSDEAIDFGIYSITGERVFGLNSYSRKDNHISFIWNGKDTEGNFLPSGIYLLVANVESYLKTFKLILLK
jgi:hypothetical protein